MPERQTFLAFRSGEIDWDVFESAYLNKLDSVGREAITDRLLEVAEETGSNRLVLLCFEDVSQGQHCHRRSSARWWQNTTGSEVPELQP